MQAYRGPLPEGARGIEFITHVPPDPNTPPETAYWRPTRPGVALMDVGGFEYAVLSTVVVTRNTQV